MNHPDRNNGQTIEGYVFTIAANLLRDRAKSVATAHHRRAQSLDLLDEKNAFSANLVEDRDPERVLVGRQTIRDVLDALAELGERTRDIFILARLENVQHREIAAMYGISVSAVEKAMMKAMAHLAPGFCSHEAFRDLSPDQRKALEEAADWRLKLTRDPSLKNSAGYLRWRSDPRNAGAREAVGVAWSSVGALDTAPEMLELRRQALARLRQAGARRWNPRTLKLGAVAAALGLV